MMSKQTALERARAEREQASKLRAGLRTSPTYDLDLERIGDHEGAARVYEGIVRDWIRRDEGG